MARPRTYTVNENYFNNIDTEDKAYWLGFLYADGYITQRGFGLAVKSEDKPHIQKMLDAMDSDYDIKDYVTSTKTKNNYGEHGYSRVIVSHKQLREKLIQYGMVENKSLILEPPKIEFGTDELKRHFIRGFFDGNGSISGKKRRTYALKIISTDSMLDWISKGMGYEYKRLYKRRPTDIVSSLELSGINMVLNYGDWLYKDCTIYLDRKYEKMQYIQASE